MRQATALRAGRPARIGTLAFLAALTLGFAPAMRSATRDDPAPEFTQAASASWINSQPLSLSRLRGQPVLIEFWTFACINCIRTLPWLKSMQQRYASDGLLVIGVHTPELAHERDAQNVLGAVKRLGISYPVMLDNDFSYWSAMENRFWPAFYLIDRQGRIRATEIGELHGGEARADDLEQKVKQLLH